MMKNKIEFDNNKPIWNSGLGYLILLDEQIKLANGYLITAQWQEYYRSLESWYITVIYWLESSKKVSAYKVNEILFKNDERIENKIPALEMLKKLRTAANEDQPSVLKKYHELLDRLTSMSGLRLESTQKGLPGVLSIT